jgi:hypothetical protein
MSGIDLELAADILDLVGCVSDPVYRRQQETTVRKLARKNPHLPARKMWITYHKDNGKKRRGSVYSMVLDRIRTY